MQQLPDAERRQAAAAMVLQLMGALGIEEQGEEESSSEDEEKEESAVPNAT